MHSMVDIKGEVGMARERANQQIHLLLTTEYRRPCRSTQAIASTTKTFDQASNLLPSECKAAESDLMSGLEPAEASTSHVHEYDT